MGDPSESTARADFLNAAFLVRFNDALRPLADPKAVKDAAMSLLGEHLAANRVFYAEAGADGDTLEFHSGYVRDVERLAGGLKLSDFGEYVASTCHAGRTIVLHDTLADPLLASVRELCVTIQMGAVVGVPLIKRGKLVGGLGVHQASARRWTAQEIALIENVADRTWEAIERARAEAALRASEAALRESLAAATAARAEAEAANRAKDDFLATLSHELRTPLTAILLWARALRSGAVPLAEVGRAIDAIAASAESQSQLVEDLLDMSRLISGKLALARASVDVAAVAHAAAHMVRPLASEKRLTFTSEIDDALGRAVVDGERIKQILWNLLSNAVKFTPGGGQVRMAVRRRDDSLEVEVIDSGVGIPAEFMPYVFERFRQADMGETRQHMGLGIGLALAKQLVELHGGSIEAVSEGAGRGARFSVRLPWIEPTGEVARAGERRAAHAANGTAASLDDLQVLLVEDDAESREAMRFMLARAGASVKPVSNARDALDELERERAYVIVSDLGLPGVSGYELVRRVAQRYRELGRPAPPSCAVSAHARDVDRQRAIDAGFDIYLAKPVTPERLIEAVRDLGDIYSQQS